LAGLLLLLALGCSGPQASPSASPAAVTPWQSELANVQPDGTRTLDSALKMMAMAFGPIPGVDAQTAKAGEVGSASPALRVVRDSTDQLTPEQQTAIAGYLTPPAEVQTIELGSAVDGPSAGLPGPFAAANLVVPAVYEDPMIQDLKDIGTRASQRAAEYFGSIPLYEDKPAVKISVSSWTDGPFMTFWVPVWDGGYHCYAYVNLPSAKLNRHAAYRYLAVDVAHCYQSYVLGTEQGYTRDVPGWAWEGPAYYVSSTMLPSDESDLIPWNRYLLQPDLRLFSRTYDAIGFYEQLAYMGVNLPAAMKAVLTDVDNPERFALAGATVNEFLDAWAPGIAQEPPWPHDWHFVGPSMDPFITKVKGAREPITVSNGSRKEVRQESYSNHLFATVSSADIVIFEFFGRVRVSDGTVDAIIRDSAAFCTTDKGCGPCPDGIYPAIDVSRLAPDSLVAVGGGTDGTNGTISGHPLEEFCPKTPRPSSPPSAEPPSGVSCRLPGPEAATAILPAAFRAPTTAQGEDGCAMSAGEPHITTVNGVAYDFQAAGEFVLLRSLDGSFELQGRQEPYPGSKNVTISTAVALRIPGHRLSIEAVPEREDLVVKLDGLPLDMSAPTDLGNGARIASAGGATSVTIDTGDGSQVNVIGGGAVGANVFVAAEAELAATGRGVLGVVPVGSDLPALPDGSVIPPAAPGHEFYQALYLRFADAWRVTQDASLFDYEAGKSTASYTISGYPKEDDLVPLADLTAEQRGAGEAACAPITDPVLHGHCVYDVGITSNSGFGDLYERTIEVLSPSSLPSSGQRVRVVNMFSNAAGPAAIDVYSWTATDAALVATVEFGAASDWFDPGSTDVGGQAQTKLSFQVHGQPVQPWGGNLYDPASVAANGIHKTIAFATGAADSANAPGGKQGVSYVELFEQVPADVPGNALEAAPADAGLLFPDVSGLAYTHPAVSFFASAGAGCLSMSLNPGQAGLNGVTGELGHTVVSGPLLVPPSAQQSFTLHEGLPTDDPFSATCTSPPILGPLPLSLAAGQRAHAFMYAVTSDPVLKGLILTFGD